MILSDITHNCTEEVLFIHPPNSPRVQRKTQCIALDPIVNMLKSTILSDLKPRALSFKPFKQTPVETQRTSCSSEQVTRRFSNIQNTDRVALSAVFIPRHLLIGPLGSVEVIVTIAVHQAAYMPPWRRMVRDREEGGHHTGQADIR